MFTGEEKVPPFKRGEPRYDQSVFLGRFRHFLGIIDPRTLFTTSEELGKAKTLLHQYEKGELGPNVTDSQLWKAQSLVSSIEHPDLKEPIPLPFRMSAFIPVNIPIVLGMLTAGSSVPKTLFWQWTNQTYNVCVNYSNRNASNAMSYQQLASAYAGAVFTSCGLAISLNHISKRIGSPFLTTVVPFIAVASAGAANVILMRQNEAVEGIEVWDLENVPRGISKTAGGEALKQVALTRVALPMPILLLPPLIMNSFDRMSSAFKNAPRKVRLPVELLVITLSLSGALPLAISLFPQISSISSQALEPEFQNLKDSKGNAIDRLYFNKGL